MGSPDNRSVCSKVAANSRILINCWQLGPPISAEEVLPQDGGRKYFHRQILVLAKQDCGLPCAAQNALWLFPGDVQFRYMDLYFSYVRHKRDALRLRFMPKGIHGLSRK